MNPEQTPPNTPPATPPLEPQPVEPIPAQQQTPTPTPDAEVPVPAVAPTALAGGEGETSRPLVAPTLSTPAPVLDAQPVRPPQFPPTQPFQPTDIPGKTLGIVSLIVSILGIGLVGLILGIVALKQSKKADAKNGFALAAIIIGAINVLAVTFILIVIAAAAANTTK